MYVSAPRRSSNGLTEVNTKLQVRAGGPGYGSLGQALANANTLNQVSGSELMASTNRSNMQNGIISYKKYRQTPYGCKYIRYSTEGRVITCYQNGGSFYSLNNLLYLGYVGFFDTGYLEYLSDINQTGSSSSPQAVYNKIVMTNLKNRAVAECLIKAKDMKLDLAEALTGLPKTVKMVARTLDTLLRAWNGVRKGNIAFALTALGLNPKQLARLSKLKPSEVWLELQYGWLPLLSDIYNGVSLVNETLRPDKSSDEQFTVVRRITEGLLMRHPTTSGTVWVDPETTAEGWASVEVKYRFKVKDPTAAFLSSVNLTNPLYIAWVALPFSFVIDWLVPVGPWLSALSAPLGLQFTSGYVTLKTWGSTSVSATKRKVTPYAKVYEVGKTTAKAESAGMSRTVLFSFPLATPYVRLNPLSSTTRLTSAVALLESSHKRGRL